MEEDQPARPIHATPPESETVDFLDDAGDDQGETLTLQDADDDVMPRNDIHIQEESGGSKAKEMEQKHPNMYF
ncbi:positive regulator of purine utilization [Fusarium phyllophilum]|uniref:Positive regulator of purine utilization n=1 Tax=Fusarium phyllophilum TaxID=47803 RepID=A0A8H5K0F1_9HYPO|nr:positive regulator of purine utilization [Fusarium phyllophilum]